LSALLVVLLVAGVAGVWVIEQVRPAGAAGAEVTLTIPEGTSTAGIARLLSRNGIVGNATVFRWYLEATGGTSFQAGEYVFRRHEHMGAAAHLLRKGPVIRTKRLVIPEGFTLAQIAARVGTLPNKSAQAFLTAAASGDVRSTVVPGATGLEGLLFPDTYLVQPDDTELAVLSRMVAEFDQTATSLGYPDAVSHVGVSPYQAVIVASMVEREAKVDEDRGPIARVIYNRLAKGMPLQVDATVQYALGAQKAHLLYSDLDVNSPYNTYRYKGLPPGPISSPGAKSLAAALNPPPGQWLYYVLSDASGHHAFANTPAEFDRLKAAARAKGLL
jgi:UPF0755 protein